MTPLFTNDENGDRYINPWSDRDDGLPKKPPTFLMALIIVGFLIMFLYCFFAILTTSPKPKEPVPAVRDEVWYREGYKDEWRRIDG